MADPSGIIFFGDPHGHWQPLLDEYARQPARAVILLGDCELDRSLHETLEPIVTDECPVFWIYGNHDDGSEAQWANLTGAPSGLHGQVTDVAGLRIAGLGGTYAGKVWYPRRGDEKAAFGTRREWLKVIPRNERCGTLLPLGRRHVILPEDHTAWRVAGRRFWSATRLRAATNMGLGRWTTWPERLALGWSCMVIITARMSQRPGTEWRSGGWGWRSAGGWKSEWGFYALWTASRATLQCGRG